MKFRHPFDLDTIKAIYDDLASEGFFSTHSIDRVETDSRKITFFVYDQDTGLEGKISIALVGTCSISLWFMSSDLYSGYSTSYNFFTEKDEPFSNYINRFIAEVNNDACQR